MFSVIIPLYNKETYIKKATNSVLEQTFQDFELIIINDGSTDDSLSIVQQFTDTRIKLVNQANLGVSTTRNSGVKLARYEYVAFLDADDWWDRDYLNHMTRLIKLYPNAGIFSCQYFWKKSTQCKVSENYEFPEFEGYLDYFKAYTYKWWMPVTSITAVIPKKIFHEFGGFNTSLKFGEDFDLWIRIMLKYSLAYFNKPLAYYNQDVETASRALGSKFWKKEEHFIFNMRYLSEAEQRLPDLKYLLDGLRVRSLLPYYLQNKYSAEVDVLLSQVNFTTQSNYYRRLYQLPKPVIRLYLLGMKFGSKIKQKIIGWKRLLRK